MEKLQISRSELENPELDAEMSDDDLAASLGYLTTLTEASMTPPEEPTDMQEPSPEEQPTEEPAEEVPDPNKEAMETSEVDKRQDEEIASIRAEIEKLLKEEELNDEQEGKTEDTTGKAE